MALLSAAVQNKLSIRDVGYSYITEFIYHKGVNVMKEGLDNAWSPYTLKLEEILEPTANMQRQLEQMDIDELFGLIKRSAKESNEEALVILLECCEKVKDNLKLTGQTRLMHALKQKVLDIGKEHKAIAHGFKFYVYEKDVEMLIDIVNKGEGKNLKLTRLPDYAKIIPPDAGETIQAAKDVFGEFLVLHNDPTGAQVREDALQEKRRQAADPILFGKFSTPSDKLFVLYSWDDPYCDYTLLDLLDDMAANASKLQHGDMIIADIPKNVEELVNEINATGMIFSSDKFKVSSLNTMSSTSSASVIDLSHGSVLTWSGTISDFGDDDDDD